jgi:hypothetical protein
MTSADKGYRRVFGHGDKGEPRNAWVRPHVSVVRTDSQIPRDLTRAGHAFYVVAADNLFVRGTPFRFNYSQSSAGLP